MVEWARLVKCFMHAATVHELCECLMFVSDGDA